MADTDASPITNHVAKVLAQITHNELDSGKMPSIMTDVDNHLYLLKSFQKEGNMSTVINQHICVYPSCGHLLAEVLANTELVYITHIDENDTLQLSPSAQVIVNLTFVDGKKYDRLWKALCDIQGKIIALHMWEVSSANVTRLGHLPQLKYISMLKCSEASLEDLAASIEAWGDQSQLTYCHLGEVPIPRSVMTGLCKCTHLTHLDLSKCNLHDKLDVFMAFPPPVLRDLLLGICSLHGSDIDHITQSMIDGRLTHLEELDIKCNPVGEVAVGHLLGTLISIRPHTQLKLDLSESDVNEGSDEDRNQRWWELPYTDLSLQFEWEAKLKDTNIKVRWNREVEHGEVALGKDCRIQRSAQESVPDIRVLLKRYSQYHDL